MTNYKLSSLSTLAIEKKMLGELSKYLTFINNIIHVMITKQNRQIYLNYIQL